MINYNADPNVADEQGRTAYDVAAQLGYTECCSILGGARPASSAASPQASAVVDEDEENEVEDIEDMEEDVTLNAVEV